MMAASAGDAVMMRVAIGLHIGGIGHWSIHFTLVILFGLPVFLSLLEFKCWILLLSVGLYTLPKLVCR